MIINIKGWSVNDQIFTSWSGSTLLSRAQLQQQRYTNAECSIMETSDDGEGKEQLVGQSNYIEIQAQCIFCSTTTCDH